VNNPQINMKTPQTMGNNKKLVSATQWLRPFTRWAARFSLNAPQWLPAAVRNAPLNVSKLILRGYHLVLR